MVFIRTDKYKIPSKLAQAVILPARFREVSGSNVGRNSDNPDRSFREIPRFIQTNAWITP
jgi:hypothetical protein